VKELESYHIEVAKQKERIEKMRSDGKSDEFDIRKQEEVLQESVVMIDHVKASLLKNLEGLEKLIVW